MRLDGGLHKRYDKGMTFVDCVQMGGKALGMT